MKKSKIAMIVGAIMILALFFFPLWRITIEAPQYPEAIGMYIWINKITDMEPNDIKNINLMNHYIGMKDIPLHLSEFDFFPYVIGIMSLFGVAVGFIGKRKLYLTWVVVMALLGSIGMYDFYLWEYDYGHNLDPHASIQFMDAEGNPMAYQPPLIGNKMLLNFMARSWPATGAYFLLSGMMLSVVAFYVDKKGDKT